MSYHGAFKHFVPGPSIARTTSGLKIEISVGPGDLRKNQQVYWGSMESISTYLCVQSRRSDYA